MARTPGSPCKTPRRGSGPGQPENAPPGQGGRQETGGSLGLGLGLGEPRAGPGDPRGSRREEEDGPRAGVQKRDEQAPGSGAGRPGPAVAQKLN